MSRVDSRLPPAAPEPTSALPAPDGGGPVDPAAPGAWEIATDSVQSHEPANSAFQDLRGPAEALAKMLDAVELVNVAELINQVLAQPSEADKKRAAMNTQVAVEGNTDVQVDGFHYDDVQQRLLGDCYLLASLAGLARQDPSAIDRMISNEKYGPDGNLDSCTVTLHVRNAKGQLEPVEVEVDCRQFAQLGADVGDIDAAGKQELWPKIIEKAYSQLHPDGYYGIGQGGSPEAAMETLTGKDATTVPMSSVSFEQVEADLKAGKIVSFITPPTEDEAGNIIPGKKELHGEHAGLMLYGNHAYAIVDTKVDESGQRYVRAYNPWGHTPPGENGWIKLEDAQKLFSSAAVGNK